MNSEFPPFPDFPKPLPLPAKIAVAAFAALMFASGLAGCANKDAIYATETALTGAEKAATIYVRLPLCPSPVGALCSSAAVSAQIKAADNVAFTAVTGLRDGKVSPADATAAVAGLVAVIPVVK